MRKYSSVTTLSILMSLALAASVVLGSRTASASPDSTDTRKIQKPPRDASDYILAIPAAALKVPFWTLEAIAAGPVVLAEETSLPYTLQRLFAFNTPWGVYPVFGYKSRTGLVLGAAYHSCDFIHSGIPFQVKGTYSTNTYRFIDARFGDRRMFNSGYGVAINIGWRADTRERFYGIGARSSLDDQSNYGFRGAFGGVTGYRSIGLKGEISLSVAARQIDPEDGRLRTILYDRDSIAERFSSQDLYGLFESLNLYDLNGSISFDSRKRPPSPLGGGTAGLQVGYTFGEGTGDTAVGYWRVRAEVSRYLELFSGRVIGVRVVAEQLERDDGTRVPFYDLAKLGGSQMLRGYKTGRFRDLSSVAMSMEYRWPLWSRLDGLLFTDQGRVFHDLGDDFEFSNFRSSYGGGLRFWNTNGHLSVLVAKGSDAWSFYINFGDSF